MRVCVAQTRPAKGDIQLNIGSHLSLAFLAITSGAAAIFFPELSITGYEPELAGKLATDPDDPRFDCFQKLSDDHDLTIGLGAPIRQMDAVCIGMIIFQQGQARKVYLKKFLHPDEEPFFAAGQGPELIEIRSTRVAPAICYELSIPGHSETAYRKGAEIYVASVAKSAAGTENAIRTLSGIAGNYSMTVFFSNSIGTCDNFECGGKTSVWNQNGLLLGQLKQEQEGVLLMDTVTQEVIEKYIEPAEMIPGNGIKK